MTNLDQLKVSPREQQVLSLLVQGCSNKEIGSQLNISHRTVKERLRMLFLRAGIREGGKRVKLARYASEDESAIMTTCEGPQSKGNSDFDSGLGRSDQSRNWQDRRHQRTGNQESFAQRI